MKIQVLNQVADKLNDIETIHPETLYFWLRTQLNIAMCNVLLGLQSLLKTDSTLIDALW
jgi:hypothetical protein